MKNASKKNVAEVTLNPAAINDSTEIIETTVANSGATATPEQPKTTKTKVEARLYAFTSEAEELLKATKVTGKQRQIVLVALSEFGKPATISDLLPGCSGLVAKGGIEPSVRYHLHHLTLAGITSVTNPVTELSQTESESKAA